jgi:hypothetical protein
MRGSGFTLAQSLARGSALAELQMVDPDLLSRGWDHFNRTGDTNLAFQLWHTLQAELWIRAHA